MWGTSFEITLSDSLVLIQKPFSLQGKKGMTFIFCPATLRAVSTNANKYIQNTTQKTVKNICEQCGHKEYWEIYVNRTQIHPSGAICSPFQILIWVCIGQNVALSPTNFTLHTLKTLKTS